MQHFRSPLSLTRYLLFQHTFNFSQQRFKSNQQQQEQSPILPESSLTNEKKFLTDSFHQFKFSELIYITHQLKNAILATNNKENLDGEKVAIICSNNYSYFASLLAIWLANGVPVPLNKHTNKTDLDYFVKDSKVSSIIKGIDLLENAQDNYAESELFLSKHKIPVLTINEDEYFRSFNYVPDVKYEPKSFFKEIGFSKDNHKEGLVIYTSGSSGPRPKGVVQTFSNIFSRVQGLINSWELTSNDCFLNALPLNHGHGLIYSLLAPFYAGSQVHLLYKFDPQTVWYKLIDTTNPINIMTSVPSIYVKLLEFHMSNPKFKSSYNRTNLTEIFTGKMRVMASASAPLNTQTFNSWLNLTGTRLIERYGLSETGFCLSNPLKDSHLKKRISGTSGRPYGEYQVRISAIDDKLIPSQNILITSDAETDKVNASKKQPILGELQVRGPSVFKEYLNNSIKTKEAFTEDGWFKTGDIAEFLRESKVFKIIGRSSVDVIQHENYTIKARDIEMEILAYPCIDEAAVMRIEKKGIFALIVLKPDWKLKFLNEDPFNMDDFKRWLRMRLPKHYMPNVIEKADRLPRNHMGKVNKNEIIKAYQK